MKLAQIPNPFTGITLPKGGVAGDVDPTNANLKLGDIISKLLPYVFSISAILLLIYIASGGLQLMLSRGDPKAIEGAKGKITNAIIGFIILLLAYVIVKLLGQILEIAVFTQLFSK